MYPTDEEIKVREVYIDNILTALYKERNKIDFAIGKLQEEQSVLLNTKALKESEQEKEKLKTMKGGQLV